MSFTYDQFPILFKQCGDVRRPKLKWALDRISEGIEAGQIRNMDLKEAKTIIDRAIEDAREGYVLDPHVTPEAYAQYGPDLNGHMSYLRISHVHQVPGLLKKLQKLKFDAPAVHALKELAVEVLPLSEAIAGLKDKVVMGRKAGTVPAKEENPNKIVKTCPCCFRGIAVADGHMAHHGYERPGGGFQTQSCMGIKYGPLESSLDGLLAVARINYAELQSLKKQFDERDSITSLKVDRGFQRFDVVDRDDEFWSLNFDNYCSGLEREISQLRAHQYELNKLLTDWQPRDVAHVIGALRIKGGVLTGDEDPDMIVAQRESEEYSASGPKM